MLNLDKEKRYLLACSYGPDSMFLLQKLLDEGYVFDAAHVNYHLRDESDFEEDSLRQYCKGKNIKLFVFCCEEKITRNIEARCREIRYSFFKEVYDKNDYDALLVAHHQDDLIETYLLQKMRKNLVNYYGLADETIIKGMKVIRPLLSLTKNEIINYCNANFIPYSIDKTNLETTFERNKIRINVVSKMSRDERLQILEEIKTNNEGLSRIKKKISSVGNTIDELLKLNDIEFAYFINEKVHHINSNLTITYRQVLELRKILLSKKPNIVVYTCKNQVVVEKNYDKLIIKANFEDTGYCLVIDKPSLIDNEYFYANLNSDTSNRNIKIDDYPLTIRSYQSNDLYLIKNYFVKVRRLFIDWKMPVSLRKRWPIIVNKEGKIIYIPRYQKDFVPDVNTNFYVKECFTLK